MFADRVDAVVGNLELVQRSVALESLSSIHFGREEVTNMTRILTEQYKFL